MKHPPVGLSDEAISARLTDAYGIAAKRVAFLPLGEEGWCYRAEAENDTCFVKLLSETKEANLRVLNHLANRRGLDFVVAALPTRDGTHSAACDGLRMLVYPFQEGKHLTHESVTPEHVVMIARQLRRLHDAPVPKCLRALLCVETFNRHQGVAARVLDAAEHDADAHYANEVERDLVHFIRGKRVEIKATLDNARELGMRCRDRVNSMSAFTVCHADIHPYNVIALPTGELRFIDWEGMLLAPRERDLMFYANGSTLQPAFAEGYGSDYAPDPEVINYYHVEWVVQEIADYGSRIFFRNLSPEAREHALEQFVTLFRYDCG